MLIPLSKHVEEIKDKNKAFKGEKNLRSEVNLLILPFFALSREDVNKRSELEYRKTVQRKGVRKEVIWSVAASSKYGYPGPLDKKVYKAVEELVGKRGFPVTNPVSFTIYQICKLMGIHENIGGAIYKNIKKSLERLVATTIKSKGTFYHKGKKRYLDDVFHLFSRVVFAGEELPSGEIAEKNYLYLNSWLLDNINQFYIRPLDYKYYKSLETEIARRLYELLGVKFYGLLKKEKPFLRYRYNTLCELIPLRNQKYFSKAKQILNPAHTELYKKGFLKDTRWEKKKDRWYIYYHPGGKAIQEAKSD